MKKILLLEPYYGGSHKNFLIGLQKHLPFTFDCHTLPARKWKWRMRFSAPYLAALLPEKQQYDAVLCSTFVDVAALKGLGPSWLHDVKILTYFHENQFVYPVQEDDERDVHFPVTNLTTALASDGIAFNSHHNLNTFLDGCCQLAAMLPDMKMDFMSSIKAKSVVLWPGIDFSGIDGLFQENKGLTPVIIWNHRWEHDKNPEMFFKALFRLEEEGVDFQLVVLGQSFRQSPEIFSFAREKLQHKILHFGYVKEKKDYYKWLQKGTHVVSTANHEFFGMAIIEAVRSGCRPVLPDRLSYPELFPHKYLYANDNFVLYLKQSLQKKNISIENCRNITEKFSWACLADQYSDWISHDYF